MDPSLNPLEDIEAIQRILKKYAPEVDPDGDIGKITMGAMALLDELGDLAELKVAILPGSNIVKGSSFADPKDIQAFRSCKAKGNSDSFCFGVGDNGIGKWGHDTTSSTAMVALPREVWRNAGKTGGASVRVKYKGKEVVAILGDTMPSLANIKNGAGIDMNPATCKALGISVPAMVSGIEWAWA